MIFRTPAPTPRRSLPSAWASRPPPATPCPALSAQAQPGRPEPSLHSHLCQAQVRAQPLPRAECGEDRAGPSGALMEPRMSQPNLGPGGVTVPWLPPAFLPPAFPKLTPAPKRTSLQTDRPLCPVSCCVLLWPSLPRPYHLAPAKPQHSFGPGRGSGQPGVRRRGPASTPGGQASTNTLPPQGTGLREPRKRHQRLAPSSLLDAHTTP